MDRPPSEIANRWLSLLPVGLLDCYEFTGVLACRSNGVVYRATDRRNDQKVAIKITTLVTPAQARRVEESFDAAHLERFNHPNLVRVLEYHRFTLEQRPAYALVMERVDGTSIDKTLTLFAEQVTVGWLLDLLKGVAAGLDHLHQQGIIHRDIKPDNIFVDAPRSAAKIGDLGIALTEEEIKATGVHDSYGTPGFVAPEQILGLRLDSAADVYSLAVTIYTLLTRKGPFNVVDARSLLYAHVHLSPVPLTMRNASWPVALERVLLQSLSKNPLERHPTATALVAEAARALDAYTPIRLATYFDGRFSSGEVSVSLYRPAG